MAFEFTDTNFADTALAEGVAVVDFWAELSKEYEGKAVIGKVNVDTNPEVSMKYGVRSIPTILILKNGEVVDKHVGTTTKASLEEKIQAALA